MKSGGTVDPKSRQHASERFIHRASLKSALQHVHKTGSAKPFGPPPNLILKNQSCVATIQKSRQSWPFGFRIRHVSEAGAQYQSRANLGETNRS